MYRKLDRRCWPRRRPGEIAEHVVVVSEPGWDGVRPYRAVNPTVARNPRHESALDHRPNAIPRTSKEARTHKEPGS